MANTKESKFLNRKFGIYFWQHSQFFTRINCVNRSFAGYNNSGSRDSYKVFARNPEATLLAHPRPDAKLVLYTDASDVAIGGALHQQAPEELQPLASYSRELAIAETRYSTYDRELLAIYALIRHSRPRRSLLKAMGLIRYSSFVNL